MSWKKVATMRVKLRRDEFDLDVEGEMALEYTHKPTPLWRWTVTIDSHYDLEESIDSELSWASVWASNKCLSIEPITGWSRRNVRL